MYSMAFEMTLVLFFGSLAPGGCIDFKINKKKEN